MFAIIPNKGIKKADFQQAENEYAKLDGTKDYFNHFNQVSGWFLEMRSTYRGRMTLMGALYYAIYNVGDFTFKPWKVIWAEMSGKFSAAVAGSADVPLVGKRPYVPDHKIFFVALDKKKEAHYLCGILNSETVAEFVDRHNVAIQVGNIFKHMRLPMFDPNDSAHLALVDQVRTDADAIMLGWLASLKVTPMPVARGQTWLGTVAHDG
ncbi:MAG TPA: hypothetical protein ACQGQG_08925 [Xylella sp.]